MDSNTKIIGVIGGSDCSPEIYELAREVGAEIARRGAGLICGGLFGVMEAACRGAKEHGGFTIGILPGNSKAEANAFVDLKIVTGLHHARNVIIAQTADALIAIDGAYGTLSEIAFGLNFGKPVIGLRADFQIAGMHQAQSAAEAVALALSP
jgi:uncharacterized protein (TIGR00725 family)